MGRKGRKSRKSRKNRTSLATVGVSPRDSVAASRGHSRAGGG